MPSGSTGNWKPRWNTTCPVERERPVVSTPRVGSCRCSGLMLASTIESSRRSNCAESLLASTTDVRMVNTATTAAAASAEATATLVRNDAERIRLKSRT